MRTSNTSHVSTPTPRAGRHVILVTFHYPPSNSSSGGLRPLSFSRYLSEYGWKVSVLTVSPGTHDAVDDTSLAQIPAAVAVHRTRCFDTKQRLALRGRYPQLLAVPDRYVSWLPFAVGRGWSIARRTVVDAVISTSPIPTTHLIAWALKRLTNAVWVADFRDPWVETEGSEVYAPWRQRLELALEASVIRNADRVTATTREFADFLSARYPEQPPGKIIPIYNGFDERDFPPAPPSTLGEGSFDILHAGLLDPSYRNPTAFLRAVRQCRDAGVLPPGARVVFLGGGGWASGGALAAIAQDLGMSDMVCVEGRVPYSEALARVMRAGGLFLLQGGDDTHMLIPAKAFEYLRTGRLIITGAPEGSATARLMHEFSGSFVAAADDPAGLAAQLTALVTLWRSGIRTVDRLAEGLNRYSREAAARAMLDVLGSVTRNRSYGPIPGEIHASA